jgi:hypothetical protein
MNMSSVKELEIQNAAERKRLMQALFNYLHESGIEVELASETATNYLDMSFQESIIQIKNKNLNTIRLVGTDSGGCGVPGEIMQFQYEIHYDRTVSDKLAEGVKAETRLMREGKVIGIFGGQITGVKWAGNKLAEILNKDSTITEAMLKCTRSWSHLEYNIQASGSDVVILGPRFTDPERLMQLYETESKDDLEYCLFGFQTVEIIARHVKEFVAS